MQLRTQFAADAFAAIRHRVEDFDRPVAKLADERPKPRAYPHAWPVARLFNMAPTATTPATTSVLLGVRCAVLGA